jgi:hypothetical protein
MVRARSDSAEKISKKLSMINSTRHVGIGAERHAGPDRVALAERL